jgi:hypothetical protein
LRLGYDSETIAVTFVDPSSTYRTEPMETPVFETFAQADTAKLVEIADFDATVERETAAALKNGEKAVARR